MADKDDKSLIGFDPLAWIGDGAEKANDSVGQTEVDVEETVKDEQEQKASVESEQIETPAEVESETEIQGTTETNDESKLILDSIHNIQNVSGLYEHLIKLLENQDRIEIDASAVDVIDAATLQLLIVLKRNAVNLHKEVIIDFPSDKFIESAELLGLSEMLDVDNVAAGLF